MEYFGIDLHSKHSEVFGFDDVGEVVCEVRVPTTLRGLEGVFGDRARGRIVLECLDQSAWAARVLEEMEHEVIVLNSRRLRLIAESTLKCDRIDAQILARLARLDDAFLRPVYQRSEGARELRTRLRVRTSLVRTRTALICNVRGTLRSHGYRMSSCTAEAFVMRFVRLHLKPDLRQVLDLLAGTRPAPLQVPATCLGPRAVPIVEDFVMLALQLQVSGISPSKMLRQPP